MKEFVMTENVNIQKRWKIKELFNIDEMKEKRR